jgi:hypothetical protein
MALSNWDTFAMDFKGNPSSGEFVSPLGVRVEVYKNWLYVKDEKAWRKGGHFVDGTVMQVTEGIIDYQDVHIAAVRGPQDGVYTVIWNDDYKHPAQGIVGCGVYGYKEKEWVGVEQESVEFFQHLLQDYEVVEETLHGTTHHGNGTTSKTSTNIKYNAYVMETIPDEARSLDLSKGIRFNQGDMFFNENLETNLEASAPGEASEPILMQALKPSPEIE